VDKVTINWANGARTEIEVEGDRTVTRDFREDIVDQRRVVRRSVDETLDLADEHDELARQLRLAAREAWTNIQARKG
jgi:hypothetical protein